MEDLNVRGMLANHSLAKSISDASFGEITRQLSYKTTVRKIDRYYPSSKNARNAVLCKTCHFRRAHMSARHAASSWIVI